MRALSSATIVLGVALLAAPSASALQGTVSESPQYGAFELKFGPYRPAIDENPSLETPFYKNVFNDDTMFLTVIELDWQFVHLPGVSLALGGSFGFMQTYAKNRLIETGEESVDYSVLNIMPFAGLFVVRVDALPEYTGIPIVPFFKIGINWYLWWFLSGGDTAIYENQKGRGATLGWQFSPGLAIQLDGFDRKTARTFDNEVGVNHSYIFVEFLFADVDRFGNDDFMNLSSRTFGNATLMAGLALEF